jgi:hypothetical protein
VVGHDSAYITQPHIVGHDSAYITQPHIVGQDNAQPAGAQPYGIDRLLGRSVHRKSKELYIQEMLTQNDIHIAYHVEFSVS